MRTTFHHVVDLITTAADKRFEPVARMADAIIDLTLQQGGCLPQDLLNEGFTQKDIAALWHFANTLAAVEIKHMEGKVFSFSQKEVRYA